MIMEIKIDESFPIDQVFTNWLSSPFCLDCDGGRILPYCQILIYKK